MRHVLLVDAKIPQADLDAWKKEDIAFWEKHTGITPIYWDISHNFEYYPTYFDSDGDARPTEAFLKAITENIYSRYSADGTDFIMFLIHEDNWRSSGALYDQLRAEDGLPKRKGVWGTNFSLKYRNYHVQYCRWDKKNKANVFGTLYHERHHALDALIATETGFDVNTLFTTKWDSITHGEKPWDYIRWKENTDSLVAIAPHLKEALAKRQQRHDAYIKGQKQTIIGLLEKLVYLYRQKLYKKDGVKNI